VITKDSVLSFQQLHTSVHSEVAAGVSDSIYKDAIKNPGGNLSYSQAFFELTQFTPYNFGASTRSLNEAHMGFNAGSTRNVNSPDMATARELMVDQIAAKQGRDPYEFRAEYLKQDRFRRVLDRAAKEADWGRSMPQGMAQGIAFHMEYKAPCACVVEIDTRPKAVNRTVWSGRTGARVTKVTFVVDPGLLINPLGYEAQMMGGINDGVANTLTAGLHLENGHFVEASWDNYFYTRQWNTPPEMNIIVIEDSEFPEPAGAGETAVAPTAAAVACAYARAVGTVPDYFPIYHKEPFPEGFTRYATVPPIPPSPVDGLKFAE
jgi:isoquinoline 1-oxidoreductase beta subunit